MGNLPLGLSLSTKTYTFLLRLGEGADGKVILARHRGTGARVAIKILQKPKPADRVYLEREVACLQALKHPNIIHLFQVVETKNEVWLVMEYAPGGDLLHYLERRGRLSEEEARGIFRQILLAVGHCHANGVAHRDLKPDNLLLDRQRNIKLADFGLGVLGAEQMLSTACGSPEYAAPEIYRGQQYSGPSADMWSLGVILFRMVTGRMPFLGEDLRQLKANIIKGEFQTPKWISPPCQDLLHSLLAMDPTRRGKAQYLLEHPWVKGQEVVPVKEPSLQHQDVAVPETLAKAVLGTEEEGRRKLDGEELAGSFSFTGPLVGLSHRTTSLTAP